MKINTFIILSCICFCFASCKFVTNLFKPKADKSVYRPVMPDFLNTEDSTENNAKLYKQLSETNETNKKSLKIIDKNTEISDLNEKNAKLLNEQLEKSANEKAKRDLLNKLKNIQGKRAVNNAKIEEVQKSLTELSSYLTPVNMNKVRDSLIDLELSRLRGNNPNKKLSKSEKAEGIKNVIEQLATIINEKSQLILSQNKVLSILFTTENSCAFEIKTIEENLALKDFEWKINSHFFFELSSDNLSQEGKQIITRDVNNYFDSLFSKIQNILNILIKDTVQHKATISIYIDGYSDSKGFQGVTSDARNKSLNLDLSQRRSDNIMQIVLGIYTYRTKQPNIKNLIFASPFKSSIGHGEELPDPNGIYEDEGTEDINRRVTKFRCTFNVE